MIILKTDIMGIPVSTLNKKETASALHELVRTYKFTKQAKYIATLNMDFLSNCFKLFSLKIKNQELYDTIKNADLITADGMPIVCFGKLNNPMMRERVTGADMILDIAKYAALLGHKIFYIGESKRLCQSTHKTLKQKFPRLKSAGYAAPIVSSDGEILDDKNLINRINDSGAGILLIGLGNPKQEMFFNRYKNQLLVPINMGVGGSFKFITGKIKRAPEWMQNSGLEWLHRLAYEPSRLWKRYLSQGLLLLSFIIHGRLKIFNYISYHYLNLIDKWDNFDGSAHVVGHLNQKMIDKINRLIDQYALTRLDLHSLTEAERGCLPRLQRLCRINNITIEGIEIENTSKHKTRLFKKYTKSIITRIM